MRDKTSLPHEHKPAAAGSFDSSRTPINKIIVHTMVGTLDGTAGWFANPNRDKMSSAHYGIGFDGRVQMYVPEDKTAYHAGNYPVNQQSIGIEFEDKKKPNEPRPDQLYQTGAALIADICIAHNIPIDRAHILKHNEVSQSGTACPGTLDIDRLISEAKGSTNMNDELKTYEMSEKVFLGMVTKSRNFDEVSDALGLSQEERLDPKAGERVANEIKRIQTESQTLISKTNDLLDQLENKKDSPEVDSFLLEKVLEPKDEVEPSNSGLSVLPDSEADLDTIERGKQLLLSDVQKVWKSVISWFWT